jgi:hypothetical protein
MNEHSSNRTIVLWEGVNGQPTADWRWGDIRRIQDVTGFSCIGEGGIQAPLPFTAAASFGFRNPGVTDLFYWRGHEYGICYRRSLDEGPPPLEEDQTEHWACVSFCQSLRILQFQTHSEAESSKERLDSHGCHDFGSGSDLCHGCHSVEPMTIPEAYYWRPFWWDDEL